MGSPWAEHPLVGTPSHRAPSVRQAGGDGGSGFDQRRMRRRLRSRRHALWRRSLRGSTLPSRPVRRRASRRRLARTPPPIPSAASPAAIAPGAARSRPYSSRTAGHTRSSISFETSSGPCSGWGAIGGRNAICTRLSLGSAPRQRCEVPVIAAGTIGAPCRARAGRRRGAASPARPAPRRGCLPGTRRPDRQRAGSHGPSRWPARRRRRGAREMPPAGETTNPADP
jgi:hypothetical protein